MNPGQQYGWVANSPQGDETHQASECQRNGVYTLRLEAFSLPNFQGSSVQKDVTVRLNDCECTENSYRCNGEMKEKCVNCKWSPYQNCNDYNAYRCNGDTRVYSDYNCNSATSDCTIGTSTTVENCATKPSVDSDGSSFAYTQPGSVTDTQFCVGSACTTATYLDYCTGKTLHELGANGAGVSDGAFNCESYETDYCSPTKRYHNEWTCANYPSNCLDSSDTWIGTDSDNDGTDIQCGDSLCDSNPNLVDATKQCNAGQIQCLNGRYQSCTSCAWANSGTNSDGDLLDSQCGDSLCDSSPGIYDSTKTATEGVCSDGLDNDCDTLIDCNDPDCAGSVVGTIKDNSNNSVSAAIVRLLLGTSPSASGSTNTQGQYSVTVRCGTYNIALEHPDYAPRTRTGIVVSPQQQTTVDFLGNQSLVFAITCEADCTRAGDDLIHASCSGINGCSFYNAGTAQACDLAKVGWMRDYNATHEVECSLGTPLEKVSVAASISCSEGTLVKSSTIVLYKGKAVKMTIASCG